MYTIRYYGLEGLIRYMEIMNFSKVESLPTLLTASSALMTHFQFIYRVLMQPNPCANATQALSCTLFEGAESSVLNCQSLLEACHRTMQSDFIAICAYKCRV